MSARQRNGSLKDGRMSARQRNGSFKGGCNGGKG